MPASPSRYVMPLSHAAVDMKPGSKNQTPGRSFAHSSAETPPLTIGISMDSPVRLSVIVMLSATSSSLQFLVSVHRGSYDHDVRTVDTRPAPVVRTPAPPAARS